MKFKVLKDYALAISCKSVGEVYVVMIYVWHFYASSNVGEGESKHIQVIILDSSPKTVIHIKE